MWNRRWSALSLAVAVPALWLLLSTVAGAAVEPSLPDNIPARERARLQKIADNATVATAAEGEAFVGRRAVFEYLLNHPEFATHITRALKLARYRIWAAPQGFNLDEGWGTTGQFEVVHAAPGVRVLYGRGQHQKALLPTVSGEAVGMIRYRVTPAGAGRELIAPSIAGFVKLDSRLLAGAVRLASTFAQHKADKEARRLVKLFVRVSQAIEDNPGAVYAAVRESPNVPQHDLQEFRALLNLR